MIRESLSTITIATALGVSVMLVACSGNNSGNPAGPSAPPASATVRSVVLTSTSTSSSAFQLTARADISDGSSRDVTMLAKWETSNASLASVSSAGVLTVLGSGQVEVRATYETITGALSLLVSGPARPSTFALSGVAVDAAPSSKILAGVRVEVTQGADAGLSETTDMNGSFRFRALKAGTIALEATRDGYLLWRVTGLDVDRDRQVQVVLYPTPPLDAAGGGATARCNDGSWSWKTARADACPLNGGIAYAVCPGPLCELTVTR